MPQTLIDPFGRRIEYVRLSVTDRCNLRCSYCLLKGFTGFDEPDDWLSFAEIERVIGAFARLGVSKVRLTGGEPLVRRDLPGLAARLSALSGIEDISLSTNAMLLAHKAAVCAARLGSGHAGRPSARANSAIWLSSAIARGSSIRHALCSLSRWRARAVTHVEKQRHGICHTIKTVLGVAYVIGSASTAIADGAGSSLL